MDEAQNNLVNTHSVDLKNMQNGTKPKKVIDECEDQEDFVPPDGGTRAWIVMVCSFFCNGILFGLINSSGVFHKEFSTYLTTVMNDSEASRKSALVESLTMGTTFMVSPVAGILTDNIGPRMTAFIGGGIATSGMLLSSFCEYNVVALYFTFGIMFGLGGSLAYTPSLTILGHYFKRNLGIVNGVVTAGSSTFTMIMSYFVDWLLQNVGIQWTFGVLTIFASMMMVCALMFKPLNIKPKSKKKRVSCTGALNVSIWKNNRYIIWALLVPFSLFGYFVPYVHLPKFVDISFENGDSKLPVTCIGITSLVGRLVFGYIADSPRVDRILLQQMSFLAMGILTMLMPFTSGTFVWLIVISLIMGLFDGCFISLLGPVAFQLCGQEGAGQAIGFLLGLCSLPLTLGPFLAGMLYDQTDSYKQAFIYAGIPPTIGSVALFLIRYVKDPNVQSNDPSQEPLQYHKNINNEQLKGIHTLDIRSNGKICSSDTVDDRPEEKPQIRQ